LNAEIPGMSFSDLCFMPEMELVLVLVLVLHLIIMRKFLNYFISMRQVRESEKGLV